jgi:hypothetical protein
MDTLNSLLDPQINKGERYLNRITQGRTLIPNLVTKNGQFCKTDQRMPSVNVVTNKMQHNENRGNCITLNEASKLNSISNNDTYGKTPDNQSL